MCADCGCSINGTTLGEHHHHHHEDQMDNIHSNPQLNDKKTVDVIKKILDKNDHEAGHNREHFEKNNIFRGMTCWIHGVIKLKIMNIYFQNSV